MQRLFQLRHSGRTAVEISPLLNRSVSSVQSRLRQGPTRHQRRSWHPEDVAALMQCRKQGLSYSDIAQKLQRSLQSVRSRSLRLRKVGEERRPVRKLQLWTPEEDEKLLRLRREDKPWRDTVAHFPGRSLSAVRDRDRHLKRFKKPNFTGIAVSYSKKELEKLLHLRRDQELSWNSVLPHFPNRSEFSLKDKYRQLVGQAPRKSSSHGRQTKRICFCS